MGRMGSDQAKRNVAFVARAYRAAAERTRGKVKAVMTDNRLSEDERDEALEALKKLADTMETKARWWISGDGPCP